MNNKTDLYWLLMVFIGFGLLWYMGSDNKSVNRSGLFFDSGSLVRNKTTENQTNGTSTTNIERTVKDTEKDLEKIQKEIERIKKESVASSLAGLLSLSIGGAREDLREEYLKISVSSSIKEKISITGLRLYSPISGKSVDIGQAVILPRIGSTNISDNIKAEPGQTIFVATASSPLGFSFRTNMCTGYLTQFQDYSPELKRNCPSPEDEALYIKTDPALTTPCLDYLEDMPRCEIPKRISSAPGTNCQNFIRSNINYNSCVSNHISDTAFPGNDWRVYLNLSKELWGDENDIIQLVDRDGKIIDTVDY
jgi:hypothetical protein